MPTFGRYRILEKLGEGGMGKVFLAEDTILERRVAIKVISNAEVDDPQRSSFLRNRFLQEARVIARLSHPSVVSIHDIGEQEGNAYIVMEYVEGQNLAALARMRHIGHQQLIRIIKETAAGLDYAHGMHVVHRDIKPANLLIDRSGSVKIADFGIAKLASSTLTAASGVVVGTVDYMAPEQLRNEPLDGRCDQYSMAALAYWLLTGRPPFEADSFAALAYQICNKPPQPPHLLRTDLPAAMAPVFATALAKNPDDRYPTCAAFAAALDAALQNQVDIPTETIELPPGVAAGCSAATPVHLLSPPEEPERSHVWLMVTAALAMSGLAAVMALHSFSGSPSATAPKQAAPPASETMTPPPQTLPQSLPKADPSKAAVKPVPKPAAKTAAGPTAPKPPAPPAATEG
ncbi:MAG: serine/threonine protein kinase [Acidobacteriia bacterium]|nr:serine/threonine protein kinase [Terriglobia bacterium]